MLVAQSALARPTAAAVSRSFSSVLVASVGIGAFASALGTALSIAMLSFQRRRILQISVFAMAIFGFISGAICGGTFQALYNGITDSHSDTSLVVIIAASILVGTLLGTALSRIAPNLPPIRGLIAGLLAGLLSALSSVAASRWSIGMLVVSLLGFTLLGPALGFAMSIAERHFRNASIDVEWEPRETTRVGLGSKPISIGGGNDDIFIPGAPAHISSIAVRNGQIEHVENSNGKRTALKDGSRLRINGLTMVVHAPPTLAFSTSRTRQGK